MSLPRTYRPLAMGQTAAVVSNHPAATQAGFDILRAGGSAADAAAAISLALGVAEPFMSGLGGDGFYHFYDAATGESTIFNGTGAAPLEIPEGTYAKGIPDLGPLAVSTPGALGGVAALQAAHGRLDWAAVVQPAIALARDGLPISHTYRRFTDQFMDSLTGNAYASACYLDGGALPALGHLLKQPQLAATLEEIATDGAETFYRGALAKRFVAAMAEAGVLVTEADMAAFQPQAQAPITATYRGYEIRQTPTNSMGFALLQQMKILEHFDLSDYGPRSPELIHLMVEAKKQAFLDREIYSGDPDFVDFDAEILSEAYTAEIAKRIQRDAAQEVPIPLPQGSGNTTYFAVVDDAGNVVSCIQSLYAPYGSGIVAGDTGILLNNRMTGWHLDEGHANRLVPGRRVRHTMNAPMMFRDGKPWAVLGTPGADDQVQVNMQIMVALVDFGLDPQSAVEAPRWSSSQPRQTSKYPHVAGSSLKLEEDFGPAVVEALAKLGHPITTCPPLEGPCSVGCIRVLESGLRMAGADPRRDGYALAY